MKENKGITLIALIITIVVMLILVAVSVNIVINSNIIGQAEKAAEGYKKATEKESNIRQITIGGKTYNSIEDYLAEESYTVTFCDYNGTELEKVKVKKGETATYTGTTPTRTADTNYTYTFGNWLTTKDGYVEATLTNIQSDKSVYALYNTQKVCFVEGTKVLTEEGLKNIEDIEKGMKVYSYNKKEGKVELNEVETTFINYVDYDMCRIYVGQEIIESTNKHPYYEKNKGWTEARYLEKGDILLTSEGKEIKIDNTETIKHTGKELTKVYNLEVQNNHNYYVGENKVLVHNVPVSPFLAEIDGVRYGSLQDALNAAVDEDTVTLLSDVNLDSSTACGTSGTMSYTNISNITLDLNEFELTIASGNNVYLNNSTIKRGTITILQGATFVVDDSTTIEESVQIVDSN